jgi:hypothetical protein
MKIALITAGLLATAVSQASPALARGGPLHLWAPSNSQQVKPDVGAQPRARCTTVTGAEVLKKSIFHRLAPKAGYYYCVRPSV